MKIRITRKNRQLKLETTVEHVPSLVKLIRFLLDLRCLDRLCFIRSLASLIMKAILLVLNLENELYEPIVVPIVQIVCQRIYKQGPPLGFALIA